MWSRSLQIQHRRVVEGGRSAERSRCLRFRKVRESGSPEVRKSRGPGVFRFSTGTGSRADARQTARAASDFGKSGSPEVRESHGPGVFRYSTGAGSRTDTRQTARAASDFGKSGSPEVRESGGLVVPESSGTAQARGRGRTLGRALALPPTSGLPDLRTSGLSYRDDPFAHHAVSSSVICSRSSQISTPTTRIPMVISSQLRPARSGSGSSRPATRARSRSRV